MRNLISVYPEPGSGDWFRLAGNSRAWLDGCAGLFQWGRSAIYWALRGLNLQKGARVWLPAYHCGVEIDAAIAAGFAPGFYRVGEDLAIDLNDLESKLKSQPGPVLAVHYFGFVQPEIERLAGLCESFRFPLIEDCAHALRARSNGRLAGDFGPISVWSIYKSLPTMQGGALRVDRAHLREATGIEFATPEMIHSASSWGVFAKTAARHAFGSSVTGLYRRLRFGLEEKPMESNPVYEPDPCDYQRGIGRPARFLAGHFDLEAVAARRRENFQLLSNQLSNSSVTPVFPVLPDGACPLVLPVRTRSRDRLHAALARQNVETYVFGLWHHPAFDPAGFPQIAPLRAEVIGLPVHQGLTVEQIGRIAEAVKTA